MYHTSISTRRGGWSIMSAQASPPTSGLVTMRTPAWRGGDRTTSLPLPDRVKNEDSHEGQEMHALPQKEMLTLESLLVEPHIRRASSSEHDAAIGKVIMLGKEWEPPPYKAASWSRVASPIHRLLHSSWHVRPAETVVVVCVMEPCRSLNPYTSTLRDMFRLCWNVSGNCSG